MKEFFKCRICGFENSNESPWKEVEGVLYPSYEMCACCGGQFGYDDEDIIGVRLYRDKWLKEGKFNVMSRRPINWSIESQINEVEKEWL